MTASDDAVISSRTLHDGWLRLLMLRLRLSGQEVERTLVEHPCGAVLLAYDPVRRVGVVVRQTRYAPLFLGLPPLDEPVGGKVEDEAPADAARRETLEEAGLRVGALERVAEVWMTPSTTTERVHLFLAEYAPADRVAPGGGAAGEVEELCVREAPLAELWTAATTAAGPVDAKLFMLLHALRARRPALFAPA